MSEDVAFYSNEGHLAYYLRHRLSPTRYEMGDLVAHLQRRQSLYRSIGAPPSTFKNTRILEVAAGTGQNSVYVACCQPADLTLLEPNPVARADIAATYKALRLPHTRPKIESTVFQDFAATNPFDIVICENWLGHLPEDRALLRKLSTFVAPGGLLILTSVPLTGFAANIVRKLMADLLIDSSASFDSSSRLLVEAFRSHLCTLEGMTRSYESWVHDCMLNPHFLNVVMPLDVVLNEIGNELTLLGMNPTFHADWRWFKTLHGDTRRFNEVIAESYLQNVHNFIDYRYTFGPRKNGENERLQYLASRIHSAALDAEKRMQAGGKERADLQEFRSVLGEFTSCLREFSGELADAFSEAEVILGKPELTVRDVANMQQFNSVFGRETLYISLTRDIF